MSMNEKAKKQILNIVEALVNLVILALAAGKTCVDCDSNIRNQFASAVIYGYFIVNCLVVANIFVEEQEFHKYWRAIVAVLGAILFLIAGALVLDYITNYGFGRSDDSYAGTITGIGVLCLIMTILYLVDTILIFKKE